MFAAPLPICAGCLGADDAAGSLRVNIYTLASYTALWSQPAGAMPETDKVVWNGANLHCSCANFWGNVVDRLPPLAHAVATN